MKLIKTVFTAAALCAAAVAVVSAAINIGICAYAKKYIVKVDDSGSLDVDAVLVLGASVLPSRRPSDMLMDRIETGVAAFEAGASDRIIMSGDHGQEHYDEVDVMKAWAVACGVDSESIFMDHAGFSTYESMYRAKEIFGAQSLLISTQKYHLYRSIFIARRLGMEAWGVDAAVRSYTNPLYDNTREYLARVKDFGMCIVKPSPTFLGDKIDLRGSGSQTHDESYDAVEKTVLQIYENR
ncbi:MAG: YdcF family protein [Clostridia bacterium]|nr:YdcF family protein [Clostridia bacterium]